MRGEELKAEANPVGGPQQKQGEPELTAVGLLTDMYYNQRSLDPDNVSLQSSFICMLHLANEKGLQFGQENAFAGDSRQQTKAESDFTIAKARQ